MGFQQTQKHRFGKASYHQIGLVRGQFGMLPGELFPCLLDGLVAFLGGQFHLADPFEDVLLLQHEEHRSVTL